MNQPNRRDFIKQLALLPIAVALPALPEMEAPKVLHLTASLDTASFSVAAKKYIEGISLIEQQYSLIRLAPTLTGPSRGFCDGMIMGMEAGIEGLLAKTKEVVQVMISQIEAGQ